MRYLWGWIISAGIAASAVGSAAAEPVTITFWGWGEQHRQIEAALPDFHRLHPDIDVEIKTMDFNTVHQNLAIGLASGSVPDVSMVEIGHIAQIRQSNELTNLLAPPFDAGRYKDDFVPYKWAQASTSKGTLIAIPIDIGPVPIFYRRSTFDAAGLPSDPSTLSAQLHDWDAFTVMAHKIKSDTNGDGRPDRFIIGDANEVWAVRSAQTGLNAVSNDGTVNIDSPAWIEALQYAVGLREQGLDGGDIIGGTFSSNWTAGLRDGHLATEMKGSWFGGYLKGNFPTSSGDWGVIPLPSSVGVNSGGSFVVIPKQAAHPKAAWTFVQYMFARAETQNLMLTLLDYFPSFMPAWKNSLYSQPDPFYGGEAARRVFAQIAQETPPIEISVLDEKAQPLIDKAVSAAFAETLSPANALKQAAEQVRGLVAGQD